MRLIDADALIKEIKMDIEDVGLQERMVFYRINEALQAEPSDGDLISRQDAINRFCEFGTQAERQGKLLITMIDAKYAFIKVLEELPSADITRTEECQKCQESIERVLTNKERNDRPTGRWVKDEVGTVICSVCKRPRRDSRLNHINFCNSCGVRMEGGETDGHD